VKKSGPRGRSAPAPRATVACILSDGGLFALGIALNLIR